MSTTIRIKRGTAAGNAKYLGANGELVFETSRNLLFLHNGIDRGGMMQGPTPLNRPTLPITYPSIMAANGKITFTPTVTTSDSTKVATYIEFVNGANTELIATVSNTAAGTGARTANITRSWENFANKHEQEHFAFRGVTSTGDYVSPWKVVSFYWGANQLPNTTGFTISLDTVQKYVNTAFTMSGAIDYDNTNASLRYQINAASLLPNNTFILSKYTDIQANENVYIRTRLTSGIAYASNTQGSFNVVVYDPAGGKASPIPVTFNYVRDAALTSAPPGTTLTNGGAGLIFNTSTSLNFQALGIMTANVICIGGGAGGGSGGGYGGGGGGGAGAIATNVPVPSGTVSISLGAGGTANRAPNSYGSAGYSGGTSSAFGVSATGGSDTSGGTASASPGITLSPSSGSGGNGYPGPGNGSPGYTGGGGGGGNPGGGGSGGNANGLYGGGGGSGGKGPGGGTGGPGGYSGGAITTNGGGPAGGQNYGNGTSPPGGSADGWGGGAGGGGSWGGGGGGGGGWSSQGSGWSGSGADGGGGAVIVVWPR